MPVLATLRGRVLAPDPGERRLTLWPDALIRIDEAGRIIEFGLAPSDCSIAETWPGAVILPGFVDTHLHYPQTRVLGSASGPLLTWLERSVFPEEARFADHEYAAEVAEEFCAALIGQGTTCAAIYGSCHPSATDTLFAALAGRGLRALCGPALMDRAGPPEVLLDADAALAGLAMLHERWHGHDRDRLRLSVVPRFAISDTPALMRRAGEFADRHGLLVQTHVAENLDEIALTRELFPTSRDYLGVYEDHGLVSARTILAHCIHFGADEWARARAHDVAIAHCPDSNFFLASGCMPLRAALVRGLRVGLGTDVGAGRTFSLRRVAAAAYDASRVRGEPVEPETLLWLATRGGACVLGEADRLGCVAPGFDADLIAIDVPERELAGTIDALLFRHDAGPVRATLVRGRVLS
ncbi:guanine deaminase [Nannocystaceae bacterium ST9]